MVIDKDDEKEIDFLKKCNRKMLILKIIAAVIALVIVVMWVMIGINKIKQNNGKEIFKIISASNSKINDMMRNDNFRVIEECRNLANGLSEYKNELLFKDNYYKEISEAQRYREYRDIDYGINLTIL